MVQCKKGLKIVVMKKKMSLAIILAGLALSACGNNIDNNIEETVIEIETEVVVEDTEKTREDKEDIKETEEQTVESEEKKEEETFVQEESQKEDFEFFLEDDSEFSVRRHYEDTYECYIIQDGENEFELHFDGEYVPEAIAGYKLDVNKDGDKEYVIFTCEGRGTGCYMQGLVIAKEGSNKVNKWITAEELGRIISDRLKIEYNEEDTTLKVAVDNEKETELDLEDTLKAYDAEFESATVRDILYLERYNDDFYINAALEYEYKNVPYSLFEPELVIIAPLEINSDYTYSVGSITTMEIPTP